MSDGVRDADLFQPSLRGVERSRPAIGNRPWRLGSQLYVAFFGGPLAVGTIAWLNAGRLRMPDAKRHALLGIGLAGFAVAIVVVAVAGDSVPGSRRLLSSLVGVGAYGLMYLVQRPFDRAYHSFTEGDEDELYDSLVRPGLLAVVALGVLQLLVLGAAF